MTRRLRAHDPDEDEWHWLEIDDDGWPVRHVVLTAGTPTVAGCTTDRLMLADRFGPPGQALYETRYGLMTYANLTDSEFPPNAVDVTEAEFDATFDAAREYLRGRLQTSGPLAMGTRLSGRFEQPPWPEGRTGVPVTLDNGLPGFVDAIWFFHAAASWPAPGTIAEFDVEEVREWQIRLRPTAVPSTDPGWPQPYDW